MPRNSGLGLQLGRYGLRALLVCSGTLSCALGSGACASTAPRQASLDAAFARIQIAEARIEHARADVARTDNDCAHSKLAREHAQGAQSELCALAREIADADALVRCEHAERGVASIAAQAERRCPRGSASAGGNAAKADASRRAAEDE